MPEGFSQAFIFVAKLIDMDSHHLVFLGDWVQYLCNIIY